MGGLWHSVPDLGHGRLPLDCPSRNTTEQTKGFVPAQKRWVVERTFGWLVGSRRLVARLRIYHHNYSETFIYLAMIA